MKGRRSVVITLTLQSVIPARLQMFVWTGTVLVMEHDWRDELYVQLRERESNPEHRKELLAVQKIKLKTFPHEFETS